MKCDICKAHLSAVRFHPTQCLRCGQVYDWNEGLCIKLDETQCEILRKFNMEQAEDTNDLGHRLAKQALTVMILDLEYRHDLRPVYGHAPLRHQFLWEWIEEALGGQFQEEAERLTNEQKTEMAVKTNPWLGYGSDMKGD